MLCPIGPDANLSALFAASVVRSFCALTGGAVINSPPLMTRN